MTFNPNPYPACRYELETDYPVSNSGRPVYSIMRVDGIQREIVLVGYNLTKVKKQIECLNRTGYSI